MRCLPDIRNNIDINIGRHMGQLLHHFDPRPAPDSPVVCSSHDHFRDIAHDRVFRNLIRCILTIHRYDFCSQRLCQFQMVPWIPRYPRFSSATGFMVFRFISWLMISCALEMGIA